MTVLILADYDDTYELARRFAHMGLHTVYYRHGADVIGDLDTNDVVHVGSWRPHLSDSLLVVADSPQLLLTYRTTKHTAPVLYMPRALPQVNLPPEASDYMLSLMMGREAKPKRLGWWKRVNGA